MHRRFTNDQKYNDASLRNLLATARVRYRIQINQLQSFNKPMLLFCYIPFCPTECSRIYIHLKISAHSLIAAKLSLGSCFDGSLQEYVGFRESLHMSSSKDSHFSAKAPLRISKHLHSWSANLNTPVQEMSMSFLC